MYNHVTCKQWQFCVFFSNLDSFNFFFFSDALARKFQTMLNESGESRHPYLVPDPRWNAFRFSLLWVMFAVSLSYVVLNCIEVYSLYAHFLESFYHKCVLNFVKSFLCIFWDYHMVFILQFFNMVYHIGWFVYI